METIQTTDIVLAAFLRVRGYKLSKIIKIGTRGTFVFEQVPTEVISEFDLGEALIEPKALNHEIKGLTTATRR